MGATFDPLLGKLRTTDSSGSNTYNIVNSVKVDQTGGTSDTYGVIAGAVNGTNKLYTVSSGKYNTGSLVVYLNGQMLTQGTAEDWVETSSAAGTFTMANAPYSGDQITAMYFVGSGGGGGGGITRSINNISTTTTAGATASTDYTYFVTGTTTLTLPTCVSNTNRYSVNNDGSGTVTIACNGAETINGSTTITVSPNSTIEVISNNTQWKVI